MKKKNIVIILFICLILSGIFTYQYVKAKAPKTAEEHYFNIDSRDYLKNMTIYSNQSYEIDGFKITLDNSIYDENTDVAYCVFSVKQTDGNSDKLVDSFGIGDLRFEITTLLNGRLDFDIEIEDNTLYYYLEYVAIEQPNEYKGKLYLLDKENGADKVPTEYVFELEGSESRKYTYDNKVAYLSPIALRIESEESIEMADIKLNCKGGEEIIIAEDGHMKSGYGRSSGENNSNGSVYVYRFYEALDRDVVENITVNDMLFELCEE